MDVPARDNLRVGDRVGYACVSLLEYKGMIAAIGRQPRGGDCLVLWDNMQHIGPTVQCLSNLRKLDTQRAQ